MSLSNEQCIEIAEKVWRWDLDKRWFNVSQEPDLHVMWDSKEEWVRYCVDSWEGFGRTVEAMDKENWNLGMGSEGIYFYTYNPTYNFTTKLDPTGKSKIEVVHLAALEAMTQ